MHLQEEQDIREGAMVSGKHDGAWLQRPRGDPGSLHSTTSGVRLMRQAGCAPESDTLGNTSALRVNVSGAQQSLPSPFGWRGLTRPGESKLQENIIGSNGIAHDSCPPDGNTMTQRAIAARCAGAGVRDACLLFF